MSKKRELPVLSACSITNGFAALVLIPTANLISPQFGGWLQDYMDDGKLLDLIHYVDKCMQYGATPVITDPFTPEGATKRAMSVGLKLLQQSPSSRH